MPLQRQQHRRQQLCRGHAILRRVVAKARHHARIVVVRQKHRVPAVRIQALRVPRVDRLQTPAASSPSTGCPSRFNRTASKLKIMFSSCRRSSTICGVCVQRDAQRLAHRHHRRTSPSRSGSSPADTHACAVRSRRRRRYYVNCSGVRSGNAWLLRDQRNHVHAKSIHALVQPELHQAVHLVPHLRVVPVQVRLLHRKVVQVVLARRRVQLPRRPREERGIVVRRHLRTIRSRLARPPDIVVAVRVVLRTSGSPQTS